MGILAAIGAAVGGIFGASLTGGAAVAAGAATVAAGAAAVGGGAYAIGNSAGQSKGAQKAASALSSSSGSAGASATSDAAGETGTNKTRSLAMYNTGSSGVLGNASVGRRALLAS